ncbi:hypothetical protein BV20DRAFT_735441 [Pilatotrama ljubarskyi]|nr:hypothetical protein BV20DRAFT_735441 [Pilatotrama ljubarskyi]
MGTLRATPVSSCLDHIPQPDELSSSGRCLWAFWAARMRSESRFNANALSHVSMHLVHVSYVRRRCMLPHRIAFFSFAVPGELGISPSLAFIPAAASLTSDHINRGRVAPDAMGRHFDTNPQGNRKAGRTVCGTVWLFHRPKYVLPPELRVAVSSGKSWAFPSISQRLLVCSCPFPSSVNTGKAPTCSGPEPLEVCLCTMSTPARWATLCVECVEHNIPSILHTRIPDL